MEPRRNRLVPVVLFVLCSVGLGYLSGVASERIRFSQARVGVLRRLNDTERRLHERLMSLERAQAVAHASPR